MMDILIQGGDGVGWSLDSDQQNIRAAIRRLGFKEVKSSWGADLVHNLCWYQIFLRRNLLTNFRNKIIVTCSSFVDPQDHDLSGNWSFRLAKKIAAAWISPSRKQHELLSRCGLKSFLLPFYIPLHIFTPDRRLMQSRAEILQRFAIPPEAVAGKIIIGSFQRDSLGTDLSKPKWQKAPDIIIDFLRELDRQKFVLLLAGPRRHYLLAACRRHHIPYYYLGAEQRADDLYLNARASEDIAWLYALCDLYLITSRSEGGPKAVLEAAAMNTLVLSNDAGLAADFLDRRLIYRRREEGKRLLAALIAGGVNTPYFMDLVNQQGERTRSILAYQAMDQRLEHIYASIVSN
jgi:glycosyltransferase involved in cell wall biosynthesis